MVLFRPRLFGRCCSDWCCLDGCCSDGVFRTGAVRMGAVRTGAVRTGAVRTVLFGRGCSDDAVRTEAVWTVRLLLLICPHPGYPVQHRTGSLFPNPIRTIWATPMVAPPSDRSKQATKQVSNSCHRPHISSWPGHFILVAIATPRVETPSHRILSWLKEGNTRRPPGQRDQGRRLYWAGG